MENKKYKVVKSGTGYTPHILQNPDDPSDNLALCSCGGTHNADGTCDGTHNKKSNTTCGCNYCKTQEERVNTTKWRNS